MSSPSVARAPSSDTSTPPCELVEAGGRNDAADSNVNETPKQKSVRAWGGSGRAKMTPARDRARWPALVPVLELELAPVPMSLRPAMNRRAI